MKRHPALVSLSHDHHQALFLAQQMRRCEPADGAKVAAAFQAWWAPGGQRHFQLEEEILFPTLAATDVAEDDPLIVRALIDHMVIRRDAKLVDAEADVELLRSLGTRLSDHVRLEERQIFPLLEEKLTGDQLTALAGELEA